MKTVVDINGRQYDARTGALVSKNILTPAKPLQRPNSGTFIDGVSRRKPRTQKDTIANNTSSQIAKIQLKNGHLFAKNEEAKTLIRASVKKPVGVKTAGEAESDNLKNNLFGKVSEVRAQRAAQASKSNKISRYTASSPKTKIASLPLASEPAKTKFLPAPPLFINNIFGKNAKSNSEVFEHRIHQSTTHLNQPLPKDKLHIKISRHIRINPKYVSIGAACLVIFILCSYFAYLKIPEVAMKVAANQAGFNGHLPSNIPAGFSFKGPIITTKGSISVNYKSNSDSREFVIIQKPSNWSSESLLTNYLINSKLQYQTYHDSGLTVYIYNEGNATWVDKGIWYSLNGKNSLSSDQILAIASSM